MVCKRIRNQFGIPILAGLVNIVRVRIKELGLCFDEANLSGLNDGLNCGPGLFPDKR